MLGPTHGSGAISVDDGPETEVNFYAAQRAGNQLLWISPVLTAKRHELKLRVTRMKPAASTDFTTALDRVEIE